LLRLVAGELTPSGGSIRSSGDVAYLPQHLPLQTDRTVADLLGIAAKRTALRAITSGDARPAHFTTLDDDWEIEARAVETLDRLGVLTGVDGALDRPVGTLSGGEAVLTGVAGLLLRRPAVSLMDEPTNNLDRERANGSTARSTAGPAC
jgi:ATPase subunit of ABC transporter with duplicated ATPase domains